MIKFNIKTIIVTGRTANKTSLNFSTSIFKHSHSLSLISITQGRNPGMVLSLRFCQSTFKSTTVPQNNLDTHKTDYRRNLHEPLHVKNYDIFGQLASSIESLRQQLVRQEVTHNSVPENVL
jgi:hypothetical protein